MSLHATRRPAVAIVFAVAFASLSPAQEPLDLFSDAPALGPGFVRVGAWNLRHIQVEHSARDYLPGETLEEDYASLVATFGKAIKDLGLDLVAVVEHQRRQGEPNRLHQIRDCLNGDQPGPWRADETAIAYDNPGDHFGNLQFGLLWNSEKLTVDPTADRLLEDLRQPRDDDGVLESRRYRAPWLVPVRAGSLSFDLMVLHLKSGGSFPQAQEVEAIRNYVVSRQAGPSPRHLVICGDWNIRPDQSTGRYRLRRMMAPSPAGNLMRVLTIGALKPSLETWEALGAVGFDSPVAQLVPFTHFNASTVDTFLDHIAISRTLDEVFDHPVQVTLADARTDLRPGIRIALPAVREEDYLTLTDHLPVVLILRTVGGAPTGPELAGLRIVAAVPNPVGDDRQAESVTLRNYGPQPVPLAGWKLTDSNGTASWELTQADGVAQSGGTITVVRNGRPMYLNNGGDTIVLINPSGDQVDSRAYDSAGSGEHIPFE